MNRCTFCNKILFPWEPKTGGNHADCAIAYRVGFEMGRRDRLQVVKMLVNDPDPSVGNALRVRRLRQFCTAVEAKQANTDGAA